MGLSSVLSLFMNIQASKQSDSDSYTVTTQLFSAFWFREFKFGLILAIWSYLLSLIYCTFEILIG